MTDTIFLLIEIKKYRRGNPRRHCVVNLIGYQAERRLSAISSPAEAQYVKSSFIGGMLTHFMGIVKRYRLIFPIYLLIVCRFNYSQTKVAFPPPQALRSNRAPSTPVSARRASDMSELYGCFGH